MALFGKSKPKKLCPMCGNPASWFLPSKVEGQPLCDVCTGKVLELSTELQGQVMQNMTTLGEYFAAFDENQALRNEFQKTYKCEFGFFGGCICLDVPQRLLRLKDSDDAFVFAAENILSFRITEDSSPLFEGTKDELVCYQSTAPDQVRSLERDIELMRMEIRHCEQMRRMEEHMEEQAKARGEDYSPRYISMPDPDCFKPFNKYYVYLELEHPYRKEQKEFKKSGPYFNSSEPSVRGYLADYGRALDEMRELAVNLMAVMNPDAPERQVGAQTDDRAAPDGWAMPSASAPPADPVAEIQKYKALLDCGAITEEEFTAKKRQLLGI